MLHLRNQDYVVRQQCYINIYLVFSPLIHSYPSKDFVHFYLQWDLQHLKRTEKQKKTHPYILYTINMAFHCIFNILHISEQNVICGTYVAWGSSTLSQSQWLIDDIDKGLSSVWVNASQDSYQVFCVNHLHIVFQIYFSLYLG